MSRLFLLLALLPSFASAFEKIETDLLVVGATESGWAAAIQAARMGVPSITIVHDGEWLGGQYTEQALACVDENKGVAKVGWGPDWHPMKRSFHRSGLFKELMDRIQAFNTERYGSPMPGKPIHGPTTFRPAEAEAIFRAMLRPYLDSGQVKLIRNRYSVKADVDRGGARPRLTALYFMPTDPKMDTPYLRVTAPLTIDASDWGEAIQVSGAAWETGPDPRSRYGEPSAPEDLSGYPPNEMNPITWAMIVEEAGGPSPIPRPLNFDDRNYPRATKITNAALAKELDWDHQPKRYGGILHWPDGGAEKSSPRQLSVFTVRRIVDGYASKDRKTSILLNYMNGQDYPLERLPAHVADALEKTEPGASKKNIVAMARHQRDIIFRDAKQHSLGVLYHLQNFVHDRAPDKTNSFRSFRLSPEFGTPDNLPPKPYIRESLRLKAIYMMREQDGRNRDSETKEGARERFAHVMYPDGLFAWQFHYDFHRTGRTYLKGEGDAGPWIDYEKPGRHTRTMSDRSVFPLRSLVPEEMDGLLGAQKNVGYSQVVSAAIRLHDQCVHIGQAAAATAAVSLRHDVDPRAIPWDRALLEEVRDGLCSDKMEGVPLLLYPFRDLDPAHPDFVPINRLAALGALAIEPRDVDYRPEDSAAGSPVTRGTAARVGWKSLVSQRFAGFEIIRHSPTDADADGIPDRKDALYFTPNDPIVWKIEETPLDPENDGLPGKTPATGERRFDFAGASVPASEGFTLDSGAPFDEARGFGWTRDLSKNNRRRGSLPESFRDTFLFTRAEDTWECSLSNGHYCVTACLGDSAHQQPGQHLRVEGQSLVNNEDTTAGRFLERSTEVEITDGRLTITIGQENAKTNTCLNWISIVPLKPNAR